MVGGVPARLVDLVRDADDLAAPERLVLRAIDAHERFLAPRVEALSPQQRLLFGWLQRRPDAVSVKTIAQACLVSEQTASPQLRAMRRDGWVVATPVGRETYYEVRDPLSGLDPEFGLAVFAFAREALTDVDAARQGEAPLARDVAAARERYLASEDERDLLVLHRLVRRFARP